MKNESWLLLVVILVGIGAVVCERLYVAQFATKFKEIEKQRIITSNKLATAKIVSENLNHVRDLVFENMELPGARETKKQETAFFRFVTTCVNDLKLKLNSVKPVAPVVNGRVTTYGYNIELEGDFFKFGELCAKFENSRRIISIEAFDVTLQDGSKVMSSALNTRIGAKLPPPEGIMKPAQPVKINMRVNTYWVKKGPDEQ